jgi:cysteate synthase
MFEFQELAADACIGTGSAFKHRLLCLGTGSELEDDGFLLRNPDCGREAFLRSLYPRKEFEPDSSLPGIYRYSDWLPIAGTLKGSATPVTYRSARLGARLGLSRLYITFNGLWEKIGARTATGTFKDCEAFSVLARFPAFSGKTLVVASAGNTARAFIQAASDNDLPLVAVVPESCLEDLWVLGDKGRDVRLVAASGGADYFEAISLANLVCEIPGFQSEGGAKNVARRDGLGVSVLSAVEEAEEIPDYYFQAVGSGTGAIAAHEANIRLNESGRFARKTMRLVISQNAPFTPILDAWGSGERIAKARDERDDRAKIDVIEAKTLSNREPPWGIVGGLFDCLKASGGEVLAVSNAEVRAAQVLFRDLEGCDISPEAGVAAASLLKKAMAGEIESDAIVMLNVTGGGYESLRSDPRATRLRPDLVLRKDEFEPNRFLDSIAR